MPDVSEVSLERPPCALTNCDYLKDLTRFNKIATQGAPQIAVDKERHDLIQV